MEYQNKIKDAFAKVRRDIESIFTELLTIRNDIEILKNEINSIKIKLKIDEIKFKAEISKILDQKMQKISIDELENQEDQQKKPKNMCWKIPTHFQHISNTCPTHTSKADTNSLKFERIKPYFNVSTGNEGVPTHFQHIYVTPTSDFQHIKTNFLKEKEEMKGIESWQDWQEYEKHESKSEKIDVLDNFLNTYKKEIIKRFKSLTKKEFEIFALIYKLQDSMPITYKTLAERTGLAPSSVRDLVNRLIIKGIPIQKSTLYNKEVLLRISDELKKISTLEALEKLVNFYGFNRYKS